MPGVFGGRVVVHTSMSRRRAIVVGVAVALVTMALAAVIVITAPGRQKPETVAAYAASGLRKPGTVAPTFDVPSLYAGKPAVQLSRLRGSTVLVNFFASWCVPCKEELPLLSRTASRHPGVKFVGIDVNETSDRNARRLLAASRVTYPIGTDSGSVIGKYGVIGLPTSFLIGPNGRVEHAHQEALTAKILARWLPHSG